jgi:plastocyanin
VLRVGLHSRTTSVMQRKMARAPPDPKTLSQTVTGFSGVITPSNKISLVDFSFTPGRIQIKAGDTVTFTNTGAQAHTATLAGAGGFDTGLLTPGDSVLVTFDQPGMYVYTCTPHPFMLGQILLADAECTVPATVSSDPNPTHQ